MSAYVAVLCGRASEMLTHDSVYVSMIADVCLSLMFFMITYVCLLRMPFMIADVCLSRIII